MNKFIAVIAACFLLGACGIIPGPKPDLSTSQVNLSEMQFDCGPAAKPLPSEQELVNWNSRQLLDEYKEAWNWGYRCDNLLKLNKTYLEDSLKAREEVVKKNK